jgi:hypothetical protein
MKLETLILVSIKMRVSGMTVYSLVDMFMMSVLPLIVKMEEETFLGNIVTYLPNYTPSHPTRDCNCHEQYMK